jgi:hypothetical protein
MSTAMIPYDAAFDALQRAATGADEHQRSAVQCVLLNILNYVNAGVTQDALDARSWDILNQAVSDADVKIREVADQVLALCGCSTNELVQTTANAVYDQLTAERQAAVNELFEHMNAIIVSDAQAAKRYIDDTANRLQRHLTATHAAALDQFKEQFDKSVDRKLQALAFHTKLHSEAAARQKAAETLREALDAAEAVRKDANEHAQERHLSVAADLRRLRSELAGKLDRISMTQHTDAAHLLDVCAQTEEMARDALANTRNAEQTLQQRIAREVRIIRDELQNALEATARAHQVEAEINRLRGDFNAQLRVLRESVDRRQASGIIPDTRVDSLAHDMRDVTKRLSTLERGQRDAIAAAVTAALQPLSSRLDQYERNSKAFVAEMNKRFDEMQQSLRRSPQHRPEPTRHGPPQPQRVPQLIDSESDELESEGTEVSAHSTPARLTKRVTAVTFWDRALTLTELEFDEDAIWAFTKRLEDESDPNKVLKRCDQAKITLFRRLRASIIASFSTWASTGVAVGEAGRTPAFMRAGALHLAHASHDRALCRSSGL